MRMIFVLLGLVLSGCFVSLEPAVSEVIPPYYTEINQAETIDGVTVELRWAYVIERRVVVGLFITVEDREGNPQSVNLRSIPFITSRLFTTDTGLFAESRGEGVDSTRQELTREYRFAEDVQLPDTLDLTLDLVFEGMPMPAPVPLTPSDYMETSIAFLQAIRLNPPDEGLARLVSLGARVLPALTGGGFVSETVGGRRMSNAPLEVPEGGVGVFTFNFSVPVTGGQRVEPDITVESAGIPITLEWVTVSPAEVEAFACMTLPPDGRTWRLEMSSTAEEVEIPWGNSYRYYVEGDPRRCYMLTFPLQTPLTADTFMIQIKSLEDYDVKYEDWLRIQRMVEDAGITIEFLEGYVNIQYPPELLNNPEESQRLLNRAKVETGYRIEGDWTFEVMLP